MTTVSSTFTLLINPSVSPYEELSNAINSKFKTDIADLIVGGLSVHYDNAPYDKPDSARWVRLKIVTDASNQADFGASTKRFRIPGSMLVEIFAPIEQGNKEVLELGDFIANVFRSIDILTASSESVTFKTPSVNQRGRIGNQWQIDVICPFNFDHFADS